MMKVLPFLLLFCAAGVLSYSREIDRRERDCEPASGGRRLFAIGFAALLLTMLFTMLSDRLRDLIISMGYTLKDTKQGQQITKNI